MPVHLSTVDAAGVPQATIFLNVSVNTATSSPSTSVWTSTSARTAPVIHQLFVRISQEATSAFVRQARFCTKQGNVYPLTNASATRTAPRPLPAITASARTHVKYLDPVVLMPCVALSTINPPVLVLQEPRATQMSGV